MADMDIIKRLNEYLHEMNYHVVIADRDEDIPIVVAGGDSDADVECAVCGRMVRCHIILPNVKKGKDKLQNVKICMDLKSCFKIVRDRKKERERRLKDLSQFVEFPI